MGDYVPVESVSESLRIHLRQVAAREVAASEKLLKYFHLCELLARSGSDFPAAPAEVGSDAVELEPHFNPGERSQWERMLSVKSLMADVPANELYLVLQQQYGPLRDWDLSELRQWLASGWVLFHRRRLTALRSIWQRLQAAPVLEKPSPQRQRFSVWFDSPMMVELMNLNGVRGKVDKTIGRKKAEWGAEAQPGTNNRLFRFDLDNLDRLGIKYTPAMEWQTLQDTSGPDET